MYDYSTSDPDVAGGVLAAVSGVYSIIGIVIGVIAIVAMWKLFAKAGKPGWHSLIPFLNTWDLFDIVYGAGWKMFLTFIPVVGWFVPLLLYFRMAKAYGKDAGFGIGLVLLSPIFMLILAYGNSTYYGPTSSFL